MRLSVIRAMVDQIARRARDAPLLSGGTFAGLLEEWVQNDCQLSPDSNAAVVEVGGHLHPSTPTSALVI